MTIDDLLRVRATYDTVADRYGEVYGDELAHNPMHRGLLAWFVELVGEGGAPAGSIVDVGCGPGHIAGALAARGLPVRGLDLSPAMIELARRRHPGIDFAVADMTALTDEAGWAAAVAMYSIIHLGADDRERALQGIGRALRPGGWLLLTFHVEMAEQPPGSRVHLDRWWEREVDLDAYLLDPQGVIDGLARAGVRTLARVEREHWPEVEVASRRCAIIGRKE